MTDRGNPHGAWRLSASLFLLPWGARSRAEIAALWPVIRRRVNELPTSDEDDGTVIDEAKVSPEESAARSVIARSR